MSAPDDLARRLDAAAGPPPNIDEGLAALRGRLDGQQGGGVRRRLRPILVAAVSLVLVGTAVAVVIVRDDPTSIVRTDGGGPTVSPPGPVTFKVLQVASSELQGMGTLRAATDPDELDRLWADAGTQGPTPRIDLTRQVVISITIPDDACPPELEGFDRDGTTLEARFVETVAICEEPLIPKTYVVALDWASTGPSFRLFLRGQPTYDFDDNSLSVTRPSSRPPVEDPAATDKPTTTERDYTATTGPECTVGTIPEGRSVPSGCDRLYSPFLLPGAPCIEGQATDCIDPDGDGAFTFIVSGGRCLVERKDPERCRDSDRDGLLDDPLPG